MELVAFILLVPRLRVAEVYVAALVADQIGWNWTLLAVRTFVYPRLLRPKVFLPAGTCVRR